MNTKTSQSHVTTLAQKRNSKPPAAVIRACLLALLAGALTPLTPRAQSATATLSGTVTDASGAVVSAVKITVINAATTQQRTTATNGEGFFTLPLLPPGAYRLSAERDGFTTVDTKELILNVGDQRSLLIQLRVGDVTAAVSVTSEASLVNEAPAVGTVIDKQFVSNLPLNGRSFQTLIALAPGVVLTKASGSEPGQFSVNGQRANANYFTVDGVSANLGIGTNSFASQNGSGSTPAFTALGGTNNLVSVDALEEFRLQTSSYAPEFGRTPGGQVSLVTRAGTNAFHGSMFEYFRNDKLDANDWFANSRNLRRPPLRLNQFGGTFSGPLRLPKKFFGPLGVDARNHTFFFFAYEGLRLRQPQVAVATVPARAVRLSAPASVRAILDTYPLPNGRDLGNNLAEFSASYSNPGRFDAAGLRVDHIVNDRLSLFGRYNDAPSETEQRKTALPNNLTRTRLDTRTLTAGAIASFTPRISNDLRFNYSRALGAGTQWLDSFGGATPPPLAAFYPASQSSEGGFVIVNVTGLGSVSAGSDVDNRQSQFNVVESLAVTAGKHALKFGADYRRLSPFFGVFGEAASQYRPTYNFNGLAGLLTGRVNGAILNAKDAVALDFDQLSLFAQDTWKISRRLTLTYGLRYELNPPPRGADDRHQPYTIQGDINNLAGLTLAAPGTPLYQTTKANFAPRVGAAWQVVQQPGRELVLRGGYGIFYDLGTGVINSAAGAFPFLRTKRLPANTLYPLGANDAAPLPVNAPAPYDLIRAFDPNIVLPRTHQFNVALEQSLGGGQTVSASYVGALGKRLLRQESISNPNATFALLQLTRNSATSDYHALQLQFQRRLSRGLQALASYTFAKSLDIASTDASFLQRADRIDPRADRGHSDFDVRHSFSAAVTYNVPSFSQDRVVRAIFGGYALDAIYYARSASPVNLTIGRTSSFGFVVLRPDFVAGVPVRIDDPASPGGWRFNNAQVTANQVGPFAMTAQTVNRNGSLGRNALRGFGFQQFDFAARRQFNLTERVGLQLRAEFFNLFNRANFADPGGGLNFTTPTAALPDGRLTATTTFGQSTAMLRSSLGGLNPVYQVGGPRSIQLALRLQF
jgi:hypothetical protein